MRRPTILVLLAAALAAGAVALAEVPHPIAGRYAGHDGTARKRPVAFGVHRSNGAVTIFNFHYDGGFVFHEVKVRSDTASFGWRSEDYEGTVSVHGHFTGPGSVTGTYHAIGHDPVHFTAHHQNEVP